METMGLLLERLLERVAGLLLLLLLLALLEFDKIVGDGIYILYRNYSIST
jgi:hypothetical protein